MFRCCQSDPPSNAALQAVDPNGQSREALCENASVSNVNIVPETGCCQRVSESLTALGNRIASALGCCCPSGETYEVVEMVQVESAGIDGPYFGDLATKQSLFVDLIGLADCSGLHCCEGVFRKPSSASKLRAAMADLQGYKAQVETEMLEGCCDFFLLCGVLKSQLEVLLTDAEKTLLMRQAQAFSQGATSSSSALEGDFPELLKALIGLFKNIVQAQAAEKVRAEAAGEPAFGAINSSGLAVCVAPRLQLTADVQANKDMVAFLTHLIDAD